MKARRNKRIFIYLVCFVSFFINSSLFAANIYVDQSLGSDCTSGNYSTSSRDCSGSDGNAYKTIQGALDNMSTGDKIYLRGGTYTVSNHKGANNCITLSQSVNGSAWTEGNYNTFASYPGEWAIIDGENSLTDNYPALGDKTASANNLVYWMFERFEVKRCNNDDDSPRGIGVDGGPFKFRYLYIHSSNASGNLNSGAIFSYRMKDSLIEYCVLKDWTEPSDQHNVSLVYIGPYHSGCGGGYFGYCWTNSEGCSVHWPVSNIIRYNYFENSPVGIKWKGTLKLSDNTSPAMTNKTLGDQYHHNIFVDVIEATACRQDFAQIYNNICENSHITLNRSGSGPGAPPSYITVYNNTVLGGAINELVGSSDACGISGYPAEDYHPYIHCYNNIVSEWTNAYNAGSTRSSISGAIEFSIPGQTIDSTDLDVQKNLVYKPGSAKYFSFGYSVIQDCDYGNEGGCTASEFNTEYGGNNYTSTADHLFKGSSSADKYKTYGTFSLGEGAAIANGGTGGPHPYLDGVTIPSYVGATDPSKDSGLNWDPFNPDPDDSGWVDYVLSLSNINNLMSGGYIGIPPLAPKRLRIVD